MAESPKKQPAPKFTYVDRPEVTETFADSMAAVSFDGQALRMTLCATRVDDQKSDPPVFKRYPVTRLVLTPAAAVDLMNNMQRIAAGLVKAGFLKQTPPIEPAKKN